MESGSLVRWSDSALAKRDEHDRPYAKRTVGIVLAVVNGGWAARVEFPFGERVVPIESITEL